jgi:hypothetical protein
VTLSHDSWVRGYLSKTCGTGSTGTEYTLGFRTIR